MKKIKYVHFKKHKYKVLIGIVYICLCLFGIIFFKFKSPLLTITNNTNQPLYNLTIIEDSNGSKNEIYFINSIESNQSIKIPLNFTDKFSEGRVILNYFNKLNERKSVIAIGYIEITILVITNFILIR